MKRIFSSRVALIAGTALAISLLVGVSSGVGVYVGSRMAQQQAIPELPLELNAGTSARGKSMSMATGLIDGNVEGLFLLDHVTGNLQCWVLSPKTGSVGGYYTANVARDLQLEGKTGATEYLMVTGNFFFAGNSGNDAPGNSVCYVGDSASGKVVGYGLVYNKQAIKRGVVQNGPLKLVCKGTARAEESTTRDQ